MKQLRIGICEDDAVQLKYLQQEVADYFAKTGFRAEIEGFVSAEQLLFEYPSGLPFECLLLDIGLKGMDGMDLAKRIRHKDKELPIIFITGAMDYALEGYKVNAVRYLLKPYRPEELAEALSVILFRKEETKAEEYIGLKLQGEYQKLRRKDILFAEVRGHYLHIQHKEKEYSYKGSLKQLREEWPDSCFVLANRSVLVNLENVERITRTECILSDGRNIPVSRGCYQNLNQSFVEWFI